MKSGRVFWGTLLVIIGVLGILHNFFDICFSWDILWKLWPLLLVLLGLSTFLKDSKWKWIVVGGIGLLAGIVLFSSWQKGCSSVDRIIEYHEHGDDSVVYDQMLSTSYDSSVATASFSFEGGAGRFEIKDTTSEFVRAEIRSSITEYMLRSEVLDGVSHFHLSMEDASVTWHGSKMKNRVRMFLHPEPQWDLNVEAGAASIEFDLRPFIVRNLNLDAGAASVEIRLGSRADTCVVDIETGASSLTLYVPDDVGCEMHSESALSSKHITGFEKLGSGKYRTAGFEDATKIILIDVESGLSSITVKRYDNTTW
jgi:hypothetical protein